MRIAFDGSTLQPRRTGVGYYTEHLLHHLARVADGDEIVVLANRPITTTRALPLAVRTQEAFARMPRIAWMQTIAPTALASLDADVAHFTNGMVPLVSGTPLVVTIHDMSLRLHPDCHPLRRLLLNRPLVDLAARRARAIVTVSESAKADIVRFYGLDAERVHVVHEAAAPAFRPVTDLRTLERVRRQYALADRIILYVGTIEPRKNLPLLLEAFARRRASGDLPHQLVCAGPYGWLSRDVDAHVERLGIREAVQFIGYVPFEDLPALYTLAEMFVYPSRYEGFGLPVVEAMACGTPVIAGPADALIEIAGGAAEHVRPLDAGSLGDMLVAVAASPERRRELTERGLRRAGSFSWDRAARETLAVYRKAMREPASEPEAPAPALSVAQPSCDVLFGQSYYLRFDPKLWAAQQPYAPLGTLYAAACVRQEGFRVRFFDAMLATSEAEWSDALDRERPRIAVIYEDSFNYLSKMCLLRMRDAAAAMTRAARARGVIVIVSGSDATDHPELYLEFGADYVIVGEGEETLVELTRRLSGRTWTPLEDIPGLCMHGPDGQPRRTAPRATIRDLDVLPRPAWDLIDVERYRSIWMQRHGYFSMNVATTRGCPYHCNWCAKPIYGQRYSARSPEEVARELDYLKREYRPDHVWFVDDIFGLKPGWVERFASEAAGRDAVIPFKCLVRADGVTETIAAALKRAGCRTAWIGAESGSQRILDAMEKGTRVDQIHAATRRLKAAGIDVGFFLQFGYPGETRADIDRTLRMVRDCRPDDIGISVSYPLPGTPFYERVKAELGTKRNWVDSDDLAVLYRATYSADFYRALHGLVHAEFQARRGRTLLRRDAGARWASAVRHGAVALYHAARVPGLRWRVARLRRERSPDPIPLLQPLLTPQSAAVPSDQGR